VPTGRVRHSPTCTPGAPCPRRAPRTEPLPHCFAVAASPSSTSSHATAMTAVTSRCGRHIHIIALRVPVSRVRQSVGHRAPVVLLHLRAAVVQRDRRLRHAHSSAPLKPRRRVQRAVGEPQDQPRTSWRHTSRPVVHQGVMHLRPSPPPRPRPSGAPPPPRLRPPCAPAVPPEPPTVTSLPTMCPDRARGGPDNTFHSVRGVRRTPYLAERSTWTKEEVRPLKRGAIKSIVSHLACSGGGTWSFVARGRRYWARKILAKS
jgi:hypothetical protein